MNMYDLVVEQVWLDKMFVGLLETLAKAKSYPVVIVLCYASVHSSCAQSKYNLKVSCLDGLEHFKN